MICNSPHCLLLTPDSCTGEVGAKHSENNLFRKLIIYRPNASPLQENNLFRKLIIYRPNASPLQENNLFRKLIIYRPNASPLLLLKKKVFQQDKY
ncbi:hypothetical protein H5968_13130 [Sphaerospermopsis sp. LEGE 00249]|uniref:hypothetical protein n=1 Tax=Sphaerospermopsis sp. LEGE 00249 TaxID=1380707 RepID=UPI00164E0447|nr:hypothetical protein [Sphaerospermopsis sp. LEGE 00249]MBC5796064.1 hypothetical protein [Sphaerospermopsis sp. LEGE 00249]